MRARSALPFVNGLISSKWPIRLRKDSKRSIYKCTNPLPKVSKSSHGFTSVELIIVITSLAILAGTAIVSLRLTNEDKSTVAADQLIADIQYAQMRAMGVGSAQSISLTNGSSNYRILDNSGNLLEDKTLPDAATFASNNFSNVLKFNSLGEPFYGANLDCASATGGNCSITLRDNVTVMVYAITGKTCLYDTSNNRCF